MADDPDFEALRAQRLAQLQKQYGGGSGGGGPPDQKDAEERKVKEAEFKNHVLTQLLSQEARARLNTLSIAKPGKAEMVENILINMARSGQIAGKLQESDLVNILERVSEQTSKKTTVKFDRRRTAFDSDDEDF